MIQILNFKVITDYYHKHGSKNSGLLLKEAGNLKSVVTQADLDAQKRIVTHLHSIWGSSSLRIIGEEDEQDSSTSPLDTSAAFINIESSSPLLHVPSMISIEDITLFVDPLDGTREFVEGRLEDVACLIGIAYKGTSIGGVVGIPFPNHSLLHSKDKGHG